MEVRDTAIARRRGVSEAQAALLARTTGQPFVSPLQPSIITTSPLVDTPRGEQSTVLDALAKHTKA